MFPWAIEGNETCTDITVSKLYLYGKAIPVTGRGGS
jgi:hypothetical protein